MTTTPCVNEIEGGAAPSGTTEAANERVRTGETVLTGEADSGKTAMVREVLLRLAAEYSPDQLRFVFGAGRYSPLAAELAALPHTVGAYHGLKIDPEPFVKRLRRERDRRRRWARAGRRRELPQLLIVLDDFDSIGQMRKDLRRLLKSIRPWWGDDNVTTLMALRTVSPHTHQASFFYPHRIHFGGEDGIDEFPEAMQQWTRRSVGDRAVLWCVRPMDTHYRIPSIVFAEEASEGTADAICGALGLPVTTAADYHHASQNPDSPWRADSVPRFPYIREANIGGLAIRAVFTHSTVPDQALDQMRFAAPAAGEFGVDAVWIRGLHGSGERALRSNDEFRVRVHVRGADLDAGRIETAIRSVDPATRYVDSARYEALWQEVADQLRGLDVDERTRVHPVTVLAQEYGWRLTGEIGPGRPHYVGPNGGQIAALLIFDEDPDAGQRAFRYLMASTDGEDWVHIGNDLPRDDQMRHLRDYFTRNALVVEGN